MSGCPYFYLLLSDLILSLPIRNAAFMDLSVSSGAMHRIRVEWPYMLASLLLIVAVLVGAWMVSVRRYASPRSPENGVPQPVPRLSTNSLR